MSDSTVSPWSRLAVLVRLEAGDLWVLVVCGVGVGLLSLATPVAVQALIDFVAFGGLLQPIVVLAAILAAGLGFVGLLKAAQTLVVELISRRIFVRVGVRAAERMSLPAGELSRARLVLRFFDVVTLEKASAMLLFDGLSIVLQVAAGMALLALYHPVLLAFDLLVAALITAIVLVPGRSAVASALKESSAKYAVADWLHELAHHAEAFQSRRGEEAAGTVTRRRLAEWLAARKKHFGYVLGQTLAFLALQAGVMTLLLGLGGWLVVERELAVGQLVAAELVMAATVTSVASVGKLLQKFYDLLAALQKVGSVVDFPPDPAGGAVLEGQGPLTVAVFSGEGTLQVAAGERVRLAGGEGAGKTRLLRALATLTDDAWQVELDGLDARQLDVRHARDHIQLLDEPRVLEATIADNLRLFQPGATARELVDVLAEVGLGDAIRALPEGLDTPLSADGGPLSRTQIKRLLAARVLLARPRLLLLDRFLDDLPDLPLQDVSRALLDPHRPWTCLCVTDDPRVLPRLAREAPVPAFPRPGRAAVGGAT